MGKEVLSFRRANEKNNLKVKDSKLAKEWHPVKNGKLTPDDLQAGSGKSAWWMCKKGHEWQSVIRNRNKGARCPYCSKIKASKEYCLAVQRPDAAKNWNKEKNGKLTPNDVTGGSGKKVLWICKNGHEWDAAISSRNQGFGCPCCSHHRVCKDSCLATNYPDTAKDWHPSRNGTLTPYDVMPHSSKKVWWKCEMGHNEYRPIGVRRELGCKDCNYALRQSLKQKVVMSSGGGIARELTAKLRRTSKIKAKYMNKEIFNRPFEKLKKK
ncbi:MAG: hypothetical protein A2497_04175 [Candidatus Firestonebacteria bacterium RifOxyC12_full_39_7]|nr:MAG: hypothetical protein A2497_04175 [Candidatus Firestonebacteria bacterium RifOxyC12_full_39_7]